jgi:hypothetical protein
VTVGFENAVYEGVPITASLTTDGSKVSAAEITAEFRDPDNSALITVNNKGFSVDAKF